MKKSILITPAVLAVISLSAFTCQNSEKSYEQDCTPESKVEKTIDEPILEFFYDYGPRFKEITKAEIIKATLVSDFFSEEQLQRVVSYEDVKLIIIKNERQTNIQEYSKGESLNEAQRKLLLSLDYSDNFNLRIDYKQYNLETGELEVRFHSPHLTIVPEKQAEYVNGKEELLKLLIEGSKEEKAIAQELKLRPARLRFTVTKKGKIANVEIGNHSDCKVLDDKMIELLQNLPGEWRPAENGNGKKIDQVLVVSYGLGGC